jgi:hypothetical protein
MSARASDGARRAHPTGRSVIVCRLGMARRSGGTDDDDQYEHAFAS